MSLSNCIKILTSKIDILRDRAKMLAESRLFFDNLNVLEVDCPAISQSASVDAHIDLFSVQGVERSYYLYSSPEYGMKRLLSEGIGDIYQLSHVYRKEEKSKKHNPEFTLVEWYRVGASFEEIIQETLDYIRLFLGNISAYTMTYREAFKHHLGIDCSFAPLSELMERLKDYGIIPYDGIEKEGRDALLNLLLGTLIEPGLGREELCVLTYYPRSQAALAKTCQREGEVVAERFEIYYKGLELANGYHELSDATEQRNRFHEANKQRLALGKEQLPLDENFLQALSKGIPECCGVAVGFDRLMMLRHSQEDISAILPIDWLSS